MSLSCDTVLDLVSIYKDGAASSSTAKAVEEHLKECRDCRRYYEQYDSINNLLKKKDEQATEDREARYADFTTGLRRRRTIETASLIFCAAVTLTSVLFAIIGSKKGK